MEKAYWEKRYQNAETGWDIGCVSRPIQVYIDQLENKELKILIPGCGYGHEASYLFKLGFSQVFVLDFSQQALDYFLQLNPNFPINQVLNGDFFELEGQYDLIIEQTLFCAIDPSMRDKYVEKVDELLKPNGKLVGLLFDCNFESGPPFGGTREEYLERFSKKFKDLSIEACYNSIEPRKNKEVFIKLLKSSKN